MKKFTQMRQQFRQAVFGEQVVNMVVAPDSLAAKVAQQQGFKAIFAAGYATSASNLAMPDRGIADFGIMLNKCREIVNAVDIPVFADADTGYGDLANVQRTVRNYEAIGAAGLFLEDQTWPKRCGHMAGKSVVPQAEMVAKIKTAAAARRHDDFLIMSRTDARAVYDLDTAIARSKAYHAAGADLVFIEAPRSVAELKQIAAAFPEVPLMANMIEDGATPLLSSSELQQLGFSIVVHPTALTYAQTYADEQVLHELATQGTTSQSKAAMVTFDRFNQFVGLDQVNQLEARYAPEQMLIEMQK
ncbi:isocitrate lyase/PEP mutase family protein [Loigolactobacillus jiayinensis]|uniref:Oxaloacetate decarboxylase n=1 Tax=Loigolactobacillus jiayinensis TaxID=2486016 RepID=A0ABW1REI4_9LACO|nr:oxaloacetate decarboxylase [Loigolactobacillus jiayinensis]